MGRGGCRLGSGEGSRGGFILPLKSGQGGLIVSIVNGIRGVMDIIRDILRGVQTKGLVPIIVIKVNLGGISGLHSLELIIKDNMVLSSDLPSS